MNLEQTNRGTATALGFLAVGVIFVLLAVAVKLSQPEVPVDADRAAERSKDFAEIRAVEDDALNSSAVLDAQRGILRLPIETAMQRAAALWRDPAAARAELTARAEKAAAPLPKAPEKPSAFE